MLIYPHINPVLLDIWGPLKIRWYGLMYVVGFLCAWLLGLYRIKKFSLNWTKEQLTDLFFFMAIGVIAGGRLGYVLFYAFFEFIHHPWFVFEIWRGGMSFHGGLLGVLFMIFWWSYKNQRKFFAVTDFIAPLVPIGLGAGRIGNFLNGELWGRATTMPWGMVFPHVDLVPRHVSQLYEFFFEGMVLFVILWFYARKSRPVSAVSAVFLVAYGSLRCFCEFFREPDTQLGFLAFGQLTMGQLLSIPMILLGLFLFFRSIRLQRKGISA